MKSTLQHDWQKAHDQGQLDRIPSTMMMSGNLEGFFFKLKCQYFFYSQYNQLNITRFLSAFEQYILKIEKKATAGILLNTFYFNLLRDLDIHPRNKSSKTSQNSSTTRTLKKNTTKE